MITYSDTPATTSSALPLDPETQAHLPADATPDAAIDNELVRRFVAGDESAFVEIVKRHQSRIINVSLNLLRNQADAEEVAQDTFIRVHRGLAKFRGGSSFATWIYRIAVNLSHNRYWYYFRRRRQDSFSLDQALTPDNPATLSDLVADHTPDPAREAITYEFIALVERCMGQLDARHREVLTMRNHRNHSYDEIATNLGINAGTVKSRIARARTNLRELLVQACPEFSRSAELGDWLLMSPAVRGQAGAFAA